jgi:hypothetical protein
MKNIYVSLLIAVVAGGLGFILGRVTTKPAVSAIENPAQDVVTRKSNPSPASDSTGTAPLVNRGPQPAPASQDLTPFTLTEFNEELEIMQSSGWMGLEGIRRTSRFAARLAISDLAMIAKSVTSPSAGAPDVAIGVHFAMAAYAEKDPDAAWALALAMPNGMQRQSALNAVAGGISGRDPKRAMELAASIDEPQVRNQIRMMAISRMATKDPRAALALYQSDKAQSSDSRHDGTISMIFHQWARRDPEAARAAASELSGPQQEQAIATILSSFTQSDPKAAWEYAKSLTETGETYNDPRVRVIQVWANADPASALEAASSIKQSTTRDAAVSSVVSAWSRTDFDAALNYALSIPSPTQRSDVFRSLSADSGANREKLLTAALDYMPPGSSFQQVISQVFSSWANEDPAKAAEAVFKLPPGQVLSNAASQVASDWARSGNKVEVLYWVKRLPEGNTRLNSIDSVFRHWASEDSAAAQAALANLNASERDRATRAIASGWSQKDPQAVLGWSQSLANEDLRNEVVREAMNQWANEDPEGAAQRISQLPESAKGRVMQAVISRWATKDAASAGEWLSRQSAGTTRDGAISSLARTLAVEDPEAALEWTSKISDERNRNRELESQARSWIQNEPETARAWITATGLLSDESKQKLLK